MKTLKYILIVLVTIVCFSCEYEIDFTDKLPDDKIVLSSFVEADSNVVVSVMKSARPGSYGQLQDKQNAYLLDATVTLNINNGEYIETLNSVNSGLDYIFSRKPSINDVVEITVKHHKYKEVSGKTVVSLKKPIVNFISIDSIIEKKPTVTFFEVGPKLFINLDIQDDGLGENYYRIDPDIYTLVDGVYIKYYAPNIVTVKEESHPDSFHGFTTGRGNNNRHMIFSNKNFKGSNYKLKLEVSMRYMFRNEDDEPIRTPDTVSFKGHVRLTKIDKQTFDYITTMSKSIGNSGFTTEPVSITNNIKNGYGIIGNHATSVYQTFYPAYIKY